MGHGLYSCYWLGGKLAYTHPISSCWWTLFAPPVAACGNIRISAFKNWAILIHSETCQGSEICTLLTAQPMTHQKRATTGFPKLRKWFPVAAFFSGRGLTQSCLNVSFLSSVRRFWFFAVLCTRYMIPDTTIDRCYLNIFFLVHGTYIYVCTREHSHTRKDSSCRYNERQLIDVTVVRRVRPRAERRYHAYHHPLTNKQIAIRLYY